MRNQLCGASSLLTPCKCAADQTARCCGNATIVLGATQLTPIGFLGSLLIPPWLIVVGIWLFRRTSTSEEPVGGLGDENVARANP